MQMLKQAVLMVIMVNACANVFAQQINDSLLTRVARRFEQVQHLSLQKIIAVATLPAGQMPEEKLPCYSGKQVTIVAIFDKKPVNAYGRMLVIKHYSAGTTPQFDKHFFQKPGYDKSFKIYYALLSVYFPPEANFKNCNTTVQVYDNELPGNKVWLIVLTK